MGCQDGGEGCDGMNDDWLDVIGDFVCNWVLRPFIIIAVPALIFVFLILCFKAYEDSNSPLLSLRKDEFVCTSNHEQRVCMKVCHMETICDQWSRK